MTATPLTDRLRSTHLMVIGQGLPELCEEAAREIERLREENILYRQAAEFLSGNKNATWENDT